MASDRTMACAGDTLDANASASDTNDTNDANDTNDSGDAMTVPRTRDDLVGKRFLLVSVAHPAKLKAARAPDWPWRSGLVRCASHLDTEDPDLQVGHLATFVHVNRFQ